MCSIMGYKGKQIPLEKFKEHFDETISRGPDMQKMVAFDGGVLGFERLSIMGLNPNGMQPFSLNNNMVVCNGEGVVVSWEAVTGATGYRLYRWNGTAWKTVKTVIGINTTSYTDRNANAVAGAKYTVQAFRNADGVNVWSDHSEAGVTAQ